ncbi:unnamed protein product [Meganyctiphanes norvegica]|uniref:Uncharacterized protein n=1 Tax=Meganyctiphanes norvegica TaxID=48144 RepID=A0AAV2PLN6_MEGNR
MASDSPIDIVQSLMQDQGYLHEAFESSYETMDFLNQPDVAARAAAKDEESSQTYAPEEFLNEPVASQAVNKNSDPSQSEFERLLNEDVVADTEGIVVSLSNEAVTFLNKTTEEFGIVNKPISDKTVKKTEEKSKRDASGGSSAVLDDTLEETVDVAKAAVDMLESLSKPTKEDSSETTKDQSDTDSQAKIVNKKTSDGTNQRTNIVSQSAVSDSQTESLKKGTGKTNDICSSSGNTAETVTTESLEAMLESLDGPAEPQVTESEGSSNSCVTSNTLISELSEDLVEETNNPGQDDATSVTAESVSNTLTADALNCEDIDIKVEVESDEDVTYTETFCERSELYDHDSDTHYFKMFECKILTIDLRDIIKTESARDAKAGLYKPSERKCIDFVRKEFKTKQMQDYIRRVKRMKLPEEKSTLKIYIIFIQQSCQ